MMTLGEHGDGEIQVGELEVSGRMMYRDGRHGEGYGGRKDEKDIWRGNWGEICKHGYRRKIWKERENTKRREHEQKEV